MTNPLWRVYYDDKDGKEWYTVIQAKDGEEAKEKFIKQRNGRIEPKYVEEGWG